MLKIDLSSKRSRLALRFFTYGVMTMSTLALTTVVVFIMLGYRMDRGFVFSQGGLIQLRSFPSSATVTVDGKKQNSRTPSKVDIKSGQHTLGMSLEGYRPWSKTIDISPGQLLWLNYTRLIPKSITTTGLHTFDNLVGTLNSPDHRWLLAQTAADSPNFVLVDFNNEKKPEYTNLQLPDGLLTKKDNKYGKLELLEWDYGSRYVLIQHRNGDVNELIRLDRAKPQESVNITRVFSLNISEAHFSATNPNLVFAKTDEVLRRLDLANTNASAALVTNLKSFVVYGEDTVVFVNEQDKTVDDPTTRQQAVGIYRHGKIAIVRTVPLGPSISVAYNEYDNHSYLALGFSNSAQIDILRDPTANGPKDADVFNYFDLGAPPDLLSFSSNGRMLLANHGKQIITFDVDQNKYYAAKLDASTSPPSLHWLDDFHIWTDAGGKFSVLEFDGQNTTYITNVTPNFAAQISASGRQLFTINKSVDGKFLLQVSNLTTE
ncbi:MAG TPA: PEGA domain-containing protein [Patescibacteria group bacterium]|jgi:hypothetical protein|nr:PEGA domain-containing protein [Patescibacteria group bacterium]